MRGLGAGEFIYQQDGHRGASVCMHGGAQVVRRVAVRTDEPDYPRTYECTRAAPQTRLLTLRHTREPKHTGIIHNPHTLAQTAVTSPQKHTWFLSQGLVFRYSVSLHRSEEQSKATRNEIPKHSHIRRQTHRHSRYTFRISIPYHR